MFKKNITAFVFLLSLLLSPLAQAFENNYIGCWYTITDYTKNNISMCANRALATSTVFFPNRGNKPTACAQFGYSKSSKKDQTIQFDFNEGTCENGRVIEPSNVMCNMLSNGQLKCKHSAGYTLLFSHVKN